MPKDPYQVLGVAKTASADEIKKAYRRLAKKYHPDATGNNKQGEEKFKEISAAFEIVGDEKKRKLYDEFGADALRTGFDPQRAREYQRWSAGQGFSGQQAPGQNPFETFGGFDDIFEQFFFGGQGRKRRGPHPGQDLEMQLEVDLLTALRGEEVEIRPPHAKTLKVRIPKGAKDGDKLRLVGQGQSSPDGGPPGNLFLVIKLRPHAILKREGDDLFLEVPITVAEAMNGATVEIPTPSGPVRIKVPAQSHGGEKLRLKGKGVAHSNGRTGDLFVTLQVRAPDGAGDSHLTETLSKLYSRNVRADLTLK